MRVNRGGVLRGEQTRRKFKIGNRNHKRTRNVDEYFVRKSRRGPSDLHNKKHGMVQSVAFATDNGKSVVHNTKGSPPPLWAFWKSSGLWQCWVSQFGVINLSPQRSTSFDGVSLQSSKDSDQRGYEKQHCKELGPGNISTSVTKFRVRVPTWNETFNREQWEQNHAFHMACMAWLFMHSAIFYVPDQ